MSLLYLPKSLYISHVVSNFYWTEIEIWAGFGPVGNTEKNWADYEKLLRSVFSCFQGQNFFKTIFKHILVSALKSCIKWNNKKKIWYLEKKIWILNMNYLHPNLSYVVLYPLYSGTVYILRQQKGGWRGWAKKDKKIHFAIETNIGVWVSFQSGYEEMLTFAGWLGSKSA